MAVSMAVMLAELMVVRWVGDSVHSWVELTALAKVVETVVP